MPTCKIRMFNAERGLGFPPQEDGGEDLFVHLANSDVDELERGDKIEYEIRESSRKPGSFEAVAVKLITDDEPSQRCSAIFEGRASFFYVKYIIYVGNRRTFRHLPCLRGQMLDERKGACRQNQYLQDLSEPSIGLEQVSKSNHRQAKHPDRRRVEKQVHKAPSRVVGPLTRLPSWPRRGALHDCVKSQCADAQAYLVLELHGEGAEHDSGDEYCCGDNVAIGQRGGLLLLDPPFPRSR